ncbi:hypothetical protein F511_36409 [Dorcoceras hygrometricum]|uniref:Uncharacterized protein n=1 Tax=Dorcoceras hygrometricum TaxID=472368 RepID=A0A2Z7C4E9_9LAMI|nr:hypothetical protein F511_36409 [Dorcoceras hygrometricum]
MTDLCCSDFVVAAACGNCSSEADEVRMLSLYYGWNWHGYYVLAVYALHCCLCAGLTVALHTHYHFHSAVAAMTCCCCSIFLPGCEGGWQYRTLISLLGFVGFVSPHAPSG